MRSPRRILQRRVGLPNGRAVLGALLVTLAGLGTFVLASHDDEGPHDRYAVMARPVSPGHRLTAGDVVLQPMTLSHEVEAQAFTTTDDLVDAVALGPLSAGQLVQTSLVAPAATVAGATNANTHELSLPVPRDRTPPGLRRGEHIALLATYGTGADAATVVTAQDATVLAYESGDDGIGSTRTGRLTLALADPATVMATAHAAQVAELTIVRATQADAPLPDRFSRATGKAA
ncbi:MAG TPA: SAF domain-containing protein [Acidimicrobiales bacterium]|nr:SAF domain-containing protein [Acidimicrobiales bacterium]